MTLEEKLEVAETARRHGRRHHRGRLPDRLERRFRGGRREIAKQRRRTRSSPVSPAPFPADIARAGEAVRHAGGGRIHTFVSTSPIHLAHQMRKTEDEVLEIITATVAQARNLVEDVEWSAMDATRTPIDYLCRCVEAAIKAGATTINLPDTVGYATPDEYRRDVPRRSRARAERRQGDLLGPLPQRSRPRRRQLAGRRRGRRAAGRMHHQRHRRAGRQRGAGRDRDGDQAPAATSCPTTTGIDSDAC